MQDKKRNIQSFSGMCNTYWKLGLIRVPKGEEVSSKGIKLLIKKRLNFSKFLWKIVIQK